MCSIGTNQVGLVQLVQFCVCSIGNQSFSIGLVDQLFQPTQLNWLKMMGIDRYHNRGLLSIVQCQQTAILFNTVGVWCPLSPGIWPCFQLFQTVEMRPTGVVHFNHINQN